MQSSFEVTRVVRSSSVNGYMLLDFMANDSCLCRLAVSLQDFATATAHLGLLDSLVGTFITPDTWEYIGNDIYRLWGVKEVVAASTKYE